jgi:transcription initiation factor IIF auxiliary subunit
VNSSFSFWNKRELWRRAVIPVFKMENEQDLPYSKWKMKNIPVFKMENENDPPIVEVSNEK